MDARLNGRTVPHRSSKQHQRRHIAVNDMTTFIAVSQRHPAILKMPVPQMVTSLSLAGLFSLGVLSLQSVETNMVTLCEAATSNCVKDCQNGLCKTTCDEEFERCRSELTSYNYGLVILQLFCVAAWLYFGWQRLRHVQGATAGKLDTLMQLVSTRKGRSFSTISAAEAAAVAGDDDGL
eukprot:PLAT184.8.p3 GENE.PLAT184.8~~PLAT184.8.p3  ORF type:complete len:179 (+),score=55.16 PLAT184.8:296-832(+)